MDLTVETKQFVFSASSGFDYIVIFICNQIKESPDFGSHHYLTKIEVQSLIQYMKDNGQEKHWITDSLTNMEMLMEGKEKAEFRFW